MILLDTNILVYGVDSSAARHLVCRGVLQRAMAKAVEAVLVPQVLIEFYAVVTSPRRVRTPLSPGEALAQISDWCEALPLRYPTERSLVALDALVRGVRPVGQSVHDVFLAAQMVSHGVTSICTLNTSDFAGVKQITTLTPETVLKRSSRQPTS